MTTTSPSQPPHFLTSLVEELGVGKWGGWFLFSKEEGQNKALGGWAERAPKVINITAANFPQALVSTAVSRLRQCQKSSQNSPASHSSNKTQIYVVRPIIEDGIKSSSMTKSQCFWSGSLITEVFIPPGTAQPFVFISLTFCQSHIIGCAALLRGLGLRDQSASQ